MPWLSAYEAERLVPVPSTIQALRDRISDLEWDGEDVTHLRNELTNLEALRASGTEYIPTF